MPAVSLASSPLVRRLRRQLPIPVMTRNSHTRRQIAEHEAAHVVVAIAIGGDPLFVHVGKSLGGVAALSGQDDGLFVAMVPEAAIGVTSVAGMVWDKSDKIGPHDAMLLLHWMQTELGGYPQRFPSESAQMVAAAKGSAANILASNSSAVMAIADHVERFGTVFDGRTLRRIASRHMSLPRRKVSLSEHWWKAINGNHGASATVASAGIGDFLDLARKELALSKGQP